MYDICTLVIASQAYAISLRLLLMQLTDMLVVLVWGTTVAPRLRAFFMTFVKAHPAQMIFITTTICIHTSVFHSTLEGYWPYTV